MTWSEIMKRKSAEPILKELKPLRLKPRKANIGQKESIKKVQEMVEKTLSPKEKRNSGQEPVRSS